MTTRLTISLNDDLHDLIERIALVQGRPKSKVIVDLLEPMKPTMSHIASGLEAVKALQKGLPHSALHHLELKAQAALAAGTDAEQALADAVDDIRKGAKK